MPKICCDKKNCDKYITDDPLNLALGQVQRYVFLDRYVTRLCDEDLAALDQLLQEREYVRKVSELHMQEQLLNAAVAGGKMEYGTAVEKGKSLIEQIDAVYNLAGEAIKNWLKTPK